MPKPVVIGVMAGSSLDGIDVAACAFSLEGSGQYRYQTEAAETIPYPAEWITQLREVSSAGFLAGASLHQSYGLFLGELIRNFCERYAFQPTLISCHGHTVYHNASEGLSVQLGAAPAIWANTRIPVVDNFRQADLHLGGQGAPLVPVGDELLFPEYDYCLNLGGIANISYSDDLGERIAYDIGPCNQVLNHLARQSGLSYDINGRMALQGQVDPALKHKLDGLPFYFKQGPRSLDRSDIEKFWLPIFRNSSLTIPDQLATFSEHIAEQLSHALGAGTPLQDTRMLVTGGGAFNQDLLRRIQRLFPGEVVVPPAQMVNFKEALVFAFLGWLCLNGRVNCLKSVTGAACDHVAGSLYNGAPQKLK